MTRRLCLALLTAAAYLLPSVPAGAELRRLVVEQTEPLGKDGYQKLTGRAYGELDPQLPTNAVITDLALAPRNARGMVEYVATVTILKPADMTKASGVLIYLVPNRGRVNMTDGGFFADARKAGHVIVASGWQGDLEPGQGRETLVVPVAKHPDGSSITGRVAARFVDMPAGTTTLPILRGGAAGTADPAELSTKDALLTRRAAETGAVVPVRADEWAFADCTRAPFPGTPDPRKVCVKGGFDPAYLYEVSYTAKDPKVLGIGFAATRDLNAFLRYGTKDADGTESVTSGRIKWAITQGNSQSGTFIRSFVHLGFNQDEVGRVVFDGANPNIATRLMAMNIRFGAPSGAAALYEAGSDGVLWWGEAPDVARGRAPASLLDRCRATGTCPKIVETFGGAEFFNLRASPNLVGTKADRDIPLPPNVRRYVFPGVRHGGLFDDSETSEKCASLFVGSVRCVSAEDTMRALLTALVDWVTTGTLPPPSQYPRLDRGELVPPTQQAMGFPVIPGVPVPDGILTPFYDYDFGPQFNHADVSGVITLAPPVIRGVLPTLVQKVNADGNETAGVASVLHQVPLGTYTGWNLVPDGFYKGQIRTNAGAFIPFAKTKADRLASGDPRLSLEERYGTHANYVAKVRAAAERMVKGRYLLQDDAERLVREAEASDVLRGAATNTAMVTGR